MGHPQDLVTLFHCCRAGELQVLKQLIAKGVSVNVRDRWDSTPLYYACLCGHKAVVQLLLESGASCNADTYDGERCLHGALTIEIRNLLKKFQICAKNVRSRTTYHQFMSKLRKDRMYADCCVVTNDGEKVAYHGCIAEKVIPISPAYESWNLNSEHLNAILDFLYTAVVDTQPFDELSALKGTAERYGVQELQHLLHVEDRKREELNIKKLYYPYHKTLFAATLEGDFEECKKRMEELFEVVCREPRFCDIVLTVNEEQTFYCHKCVVCLRSPYIQSFVEFADNTEETNVQQLHLNSINIDVFREALRYIYTDNIQLVRVILLLQSSPSCIGRLTPLTHMTCLK
uniref:BTB domain-containing protein n=1 Tax=Steinernema glaseri TaxID=37863 RepID=A0A1I7YZ67_9BILA